MPLQPPAHTETPESLFADGALTINAAVKEFGMSRASVYRLMSAGRLPFSQSGTSRRLIPRRALARLLAEGLVKEDE